MGKPTKMPVAMKSKAVKGKASKVSKAKVKAQAAKPTVARIGKASLRTALLATMKEQSGRSDLDFQPASKAAEAVADDVPVEQRAGYPVNLQQGAVDPAEWRTATKVMGPVWHSHLQGSSMQTNAEYARLTNSIDTSLTFLHVIAVCLISHTSVARFKSFRGSGQD